MFDNANPRDGGTERDSGLSVGQRITEIQGHINAAQAELVAAVAELEATDAWAEPGVLSPAHWVAWQCGMGHAAAKKIIDTTRSLEHLPETRASFARGELSLEQVHCLTEVATPGTETELLQLAHDATTAQLKKLIGGYRTALRHMHSAELHASRYLSTSYCADGSFKLSGRFSPEEGALIRKALDKARDELRGEVSSDDPEDPERTVNQADCLVAIAEGSLAGALTARSAAERYQVVINVDAEALLADGGEVCRIQDGPQIHPEMARRIACDSSLVALLRSADGTILDAGRKLRGVSPAMRRALHARDTCCRWPGCDRTHYTEAHHIAHWTRDLGPTKLKNLVRLCSTHHDLVHAGKMSCEPRDGGGFIFHLPDGSPVNDFTRQMAATGASLRQRHQLEGIDISPDTCVTGWEGDKLHLADAVYTLFFQKGDIERRKAQRAAMEDRRSTSQAAEAEPKEHDDSG